MLSFGAQKIDFEAQNLFKFSFNIIFTSKFPQDKLSRSTITFSSPSALSKYRNSVLKLETF